MLKSALPWVALTALAVAGWLHTEAPAPSGPTPPAPLCPGPNCPIVPAPVPVPAPAPQPKRPRRPWAANVRLTVVSHDAPALIEVEKQGDCVWLTWPDRQQYVLRQGDTQLGNWLTSTQRYYALTGAQWGEADDPPLAPPAEALRGEPEPAIDLLAMPSDHRKRNIASKGAGCCTFRSAEYCCRWSNNDVLNDLPEWMKSTGIAGGGYPGKQAEVVQKCAAAHNKPCPKFFQYEGKDQSSVASVIERILKSGRPCGVTWQSNHMLVAVHCDAERVGIVDNNAPDRVQWYSRADGLRRICQGGGGWVFAITEAPPPPSPKSAAPLRACTCCDDPASCTCGCRQGKPCRCAIERRKPRFPRLPFPKHPRPWRPKHQVRVVADEAETIPAGVIGLKPVMTEVYSLCGRTVSRKEFEDEFPDETSKLHVTVIGPPRQELAALASTHLVQTYPAGNWALGCGFVQTGQQVYLQSHDGRVLYRDPGTLTGPALLDALRRADPSYRPDSDPGPNQPRPGPDQGGSNLDRCKDWARLQGKMFWLAISGASGAGWLAMKKRDGQVPAPARVPTPPPPPPPQPAMSAETLAAVVAQAVRMSQAPRT